MEIGKTKWYSLNNVIFSQTINDMISIIETKYINKFYMDGWVNL